MKPMLNTRNEHLEAQIWTHFAFKPTFTPRPELCGGAANGGELPTAETSVRRNTLLLARTRSFASPARKHATHETKTKTKRSRSPGSGLPPGFPLTSDSLTAPLSWLLAPPRWRLISQPASSGRFSFACCLQFVCALAVPSLSLIHI